MHSPTPTLDASQLDTLLTIYRLFNQTGEWPTFEQLDYEFDQDHQVEGWAALQDLPTGFVSGSDLRTLPADHQQISLTILGMAAVSEADNEAVEDFRVFCGSVVWAARESQATRPPETAHINGQELANLIDMPAAGRSALIARVGRQWAVNGHLWTQMNGVGDSWTVVLNRKALRAYRGVVEEPHFLAAEHDRLARIDAERQAFIAPSRNRSNLHSTHSAASSDPGLPAWFALLPETMADAVRSRLQTGHNEDALLQAWKTLSAAIGAFSGRDLDGYDLVNQAFRGFDLSGHTPAQRNGHEGFVDMMRGLSRIRNVYAHPGANVLDELDTAAFILTAGACLRWVDSLKGSTGGDTS